MMQRFAIALVLLVASLLEQSRSVRVGDEHEAHKAISDNGLQAVGEEAVKFCQNSILVMRAAREFRKAAQAADMPKALVALEQVKAHIEALNEVQLSEIRISSDSRAASLEFLNKAFLNGLIKNFTTLGIEPYVKVCKDVAAKYNVEPPSRDFIRQGDGNKSPMEWFVWNINAGVTSSPELQKMLEGMGLDLAEVFLIALNSASETRTLSDGAAAFTGAMQDSETIQVAEAEEEAISKKCPAGGVGQKLQCVGEAAKDVIEQKVLAPLGDFFSMLTGQGSLLELDADVITDELSNGTSLVHDSQKTKIYTYAQLKARAKQAASSAARFAMDSPRVQRVVDQMMARGGVSAIGSIGVWIVGRLIPGLIKTALVIVGAVGAAVVVLGAAIVAAPIMLATLGFKFFGLR